MSAVAKERAIIMSSPMVRATLRGTKTQTRRVVVARSNDGRHALGADWRFVSQRDTVTGAADYREGNWLWQHRTNIGRVLVERCPYGQVGDRLWVREAHAIAVAEDGREVCAYRASCIADHFDYVTTDGALTSVRVPRWTSPRFMPRRASRITLRVTGVRVERLHDITEEDARAEGIPYSIPGTLCTDVRAEYRELWDRINERRFPWASNPWVWVISYSNESNRAAEERPCG